MSKWEFSPNRAPRLRCGPVGVPVVRRGLPPSLWLACIAYASICDVRKVEFAPAAFRHGFRPDDFYHLLARRYIKVRSQKGIDDVYELLGRSAAGDYLHIVYRVLPGGTKVRVFHMGRMSVAQRRRFQKLVRR